MTERRGPAVLLVLEPVVKTIWRLGAVLALMVGALAVAQAPAAADDCAGVTVVVDDGSDVQARCAPAGVSGMQALEEAGFSVYTTDNGGFVCQIDGKPAKSKCKDSANETSWYYFHAGEDGKWESSSLGAGNRTVIEGGFEGWNFGPKEPPDYDVSSASDGTDSDGATADSSAASSSDDDSTSLATWIAGAVVIVVIIASIVASVRRRN